MATNPIGKDSVNVNVNVPRWLRKELEQLAANSKMTLSEYVRSVLTNAAEIGAQFEIRLVTKELGSGEPGKYPRHKQHEEVREEKPGAYGQGSLPPHHMNERGEKSTPPPAKQSQKVAGNKPPERN